MERSIRDRATRLNAGMPAAIYHKLNGSTNEVFDETAFHLMHALELPLLEDANAIAVTATCIIRALTTQQINHRTAALVLYGLQICSTNLSRVRTQPSSYSPVATSDPEPLHELASMLAEFREKKKAAASAVAASEATAADSNPQAGSEEDEEDDLKLSSA